MHKYFNRTLYVDLDDFTIMYQIQFCIEPPGQNPCTAAGEFFIADFAVMRTNLDGDLEMYVFDSKLSSTTAFTSNQLAASQKGQLTIKAVNGDGTPLRGSDLDLTSGDVVDNLTQHEELNGQVVNGFRKIYSQGGDPNTLGGIKL